MDTELGAFGSSEAGVVIFKIGLIQLPSAPVSGFKNCCKTVKNGCESSNELTSNSTSVTDFKSVAGIVLTVEGEGTAPVFAALGLLPLAPFLPLSALVVLDSPT